MTMNNNSPVSIHLCVYCFYSLVHVYIWKYSIVFVYTHPI